MMNVDEALLKNMTVDQDLAINFLTINVAKHATHFQHDSRMKPHIMQYLRTSLSGL